MPRIAIIGAGITGVTSASCASRLRRFRLRPPALSRDGNLLRQRRPAVGQQRRGLEQRRHRAQGLRWLGRSNAPLLLNPRFSWHKYSWLLQFMRQIPTAATPSPPPGWRSRRQHHDMAEAEDIDFDLERRGILHIYHDAASFEAARRGNELLREGGLERYAVTPEEARDIEPALQTACHAGLHAVRRHRRHPQVHARAGPGLRATGRALRAGRRRRRDRGRRRGLRAEPGRHGRRRRPAPGRRRGGLRRRGQPTLRAAAGRHGQHLSGQGLFDQRAPGRRRQPRGRAASACSTRPPRSSPAGWATASAWPAPPSSTATTWTSAPNACSRWWTGPAATSPASGRRAWCPGAAAPDDAGHDAARGSGQAAGRVLQHRPRPPGLDLVGGHRAATGGQRRRTAAASLRRRGLAARSSPSPCASAPVGASPARRSRSRSAHGGHHVAGGTPPVHSFIQPIMKGVAKPARLPTELMKAMPPAAVPVKKPAGIAQNTGNAPNTPIADTLSAAMASTGLPMQAAVSASPPRRPAWRRRNAGAARRSCRSARH